MNDSKETWEVKIFLSKDASCLNIFEYGCQTKQERTIGDIFERIAICFEFSS